MTLRLIVLTALATAFLGCGTPIDNPYEACFSGDGCAGGTTCLATTLPQNAGYTGSLCTTPCNDSTDCLQLIANFSAICVSGQCYIQCPDGGGNCPYGTACLTFQDQNGDAVNLCTP